MKQIVLTVCLALATHIATGKDEAAPGATAHFGSTSFSGKVAETMSTAGYTYVLVNTGSNKMWAAATQFAVKVGDTVTVADGMAMPNYHSKSLNRDFDVVYFSGSVTVNDVKAGTAATGSKLPANHPPLPVASAKPKVDKVELTGIKRAEGGQTIQEMFAKKSKLVGKSVKVRGKVVKYNAMIMGRNWLHVQDGTGSVGNHDLVVTTTTEAKVGDTVLVNGVLSKDKDFGAGYKYDVIIDNASVVVE